MTFISHIFRFLLLSLLMGLAVARLQKRDTPLLQTVSISLTFDASRRYLAHVNMVRSSILSSIGSSYTYDENIDSHRDLKNSRSRLRYPQRLGTLCFVILWRRVSYEFGQRLHGSRC